VTRCVQGARIPFLQGDPVLNTVILSNPADRIHGITNDPEPPVFL
jgi:hypothetical protein